MAKRLYAFLSVAVLMVVSGCGGGDGAATGSGDTTGTDAIQQQIEKELPKPASAGEPVKAQRGEVVTSGGAVAAPQTSGDVPDNK